mgnify:CR=1 FL=1
MKKFRLIKEYPGSPKLGTIVTAAKEYILMNKPCLSFNDVEKVWFMSVDSFIFMRKGLKDLVKSKLNI